MVKLKESKVMRIVAKRTDGKPRTYSNYIEVSKTNFDVTIKFCDIKPPANEEESKILVEKGLVEAPIVSEIVLQENVAKALIKALISQLDENKAGKN